MWRAEFKKADSSQQSLILTQFAHPSNSHHSAAAAAAVRIPVNRSEAWNYTGLFDSLSPKDFFPSLLQLLAAAWRPPRGNT